MMLTSFFGKSSPINFLLLGIFIAVFCVLKVVLDHGFVLQWQEIASQIFIIVLLVFSMLLLDFMVRKNYLNTSNTFAIFIFSCLVAMLPVMPFGAWSSRRLKSNLLFWVRVRPSTKILTSPLLIITGTK